VVAVKAFRKGGKHVAADVENEVKALEMMNTLEKDHIVRFLTSFQRGTPDDLEYFLLFEWAHGGNLGDFWKQQAELPRTAELMKWLIEQLRGLAKALTAAHGAVCRHGDLKPANILWFRDATCPYGTLKIGDWGEAKIHKDVTSLRHVDTDAGYGTRRYEPPETGPPSPRQGQGLPKRSRLYDIWGFGCIIFECIIWYLYDTERLNKFNNSNWGTYDFFYERNRAGIAKVHGKVELWIEKMSKDALCRSGETALGDLLQIVRTGLLVVELPKDGGPVSQADGGPPQDTKARSTEPVHAQKSLDADISHPTIEVTAPEPSKLDDAVETSNTHGITPTFNITEPLVTEPTGLRTSEPKHNFRLRADQLEEDLSRILQTQGENRYWDRFQGPRPEPVDTDSSSHLLAPSGPHISTATNLRVPSTHKVDYEHPSLDPEDWQFELDNMFAAKLDTITSTPSPQSSPAPNLCTECKDFGERLPETNFSISYTTQVLKHNAKARLCNLCCFLWQTHQRYASPECKEVRFHRVGSTMYMSGANSPVYTLLRSNGKPAL
jgi:serine/threonine protein kinase